MEMSYQGNSGRLTLYMPLNFHASLGRPMFIAWDQSKWTAKQNVLQGKNLTSSELLKDQNS